MKKIKEQSGDDFRLSQTSVQRNKALENLAIAKALNRPVRRVPQGYSTDWLRLKGEDITEQKKQAVPKTQKDKYNHSIYDAAIVKELAQEWGYFKVTIVQKLSPNSKNKNSDNIKKDYIKKLELKKIKS